MLGKSHKVENKVGRMQNSVRRPDRFSGLKINTSADGDQYISRHPFEKTRKWLNVSDKQIWVTGEVISCSWVK